MKIQGRIPEKTTIRAKVIRKDGTVEELGPISVEESRKGIVQKIKENFKEVTKCQQ